MAAKTFQCGDSPQIQLNAEGNLAISGWDQESVEAQIRKEENLTVEEGENNLKFFAESDLALKVPENSNLQINLVEGSLSIKSVQGQINIQSVGGHLTMNATGPVTCSNVSGHCKFTDTIGEIRIRNIGGNLKGSKSAAPLAVVNVGGHIKLLDVMLIEKVHAGGNIKVKLGNAPEELEALAGGNIKLWIPVDSNLKLEAHSGGEKVVFQSGMESQRVGNSQYRTTIGDGGPLVRLHAGGNVYVLNTGWEEDLTMDDFNATEDSISRKMDAVAEERIQKKIEAKMRQAEMKANAASRRAEEKINAAMRKAERYKMRGAEDRWAPDGFGIPTPPAPEEPKTKVSDEERMLILNMLSEKKITAEEANQLLDALSGKFGK